jgi:anti-anti-sigma factor
MRPAPFDLRVELTDTKARLVATGELDLANAPRLEREVEAARGRAEEVVIDLSGVTFLDSSGLKVLIVMSARAQDEGWKLGLVAPDGHARSIFEISGVERHLPFVCFDELVSELCGTMLPDDHLDKELRELDEVPPDPFA